MNFTRPSHGLNKVSMAHKRRPKRRTISMKSFNLLNLIAAIVLVSGTAVAAGPSLDPNLPN